MNILITGGTGLIGRHLCAALLAQGHTLTVLSRQPHTVALKCGAGVIAMASLQAWHADNYFDAVINLAGEPIMAARWTTKRKAQLWRSRVDLTEQLVQCIANATRKPSVLLSGSALGFYGHGGDALLSETAAAGTDFGALLCNAWETAAMRAEASGVRVCLLRTGLVLAKEGGLLAKMRLPFQLGLAARLGKGRQWLSWIAMADYINALLLLLTNTNANGAYNLTAPQPVTNMYFTKTFAKQLHRPALFITPAWLLTLLLGEMAQLLLDSQRVLPTKLLALGYAFTYPDLELSLQHIMGNNA